MRRSPVFSVLLAVVAASLSTAALGAGWVPTPPTLIVDSDKSKQLLDVAFSSNGDGIAVWSQGTPTGSAVAASIRHDGTWSLPAILDESTSSVMYPLAVIDAAGFATVIWHSAVSSPAPDKEIAYATRPSGGSWSAPAEIVPDLQSESPVLTISPDGVVTAAWQSPAGVGLADKPAGSTSWAAPTNLGPGNSPALAAAPDSRVAVAWGSSSLLKVKVRAAAGTWGAAATETGSVEDPGTTWPDNVNEPSIGFGADGALHAAFWEYVDPTAGQLLEQIRTSSRTTGGVWTEHPEPISAPDVITHPDAVVGDAQGNVTVLWTSVVQPTFDNRYFTATRVGGTWEAAYPLTGPDLPTGVSRGTLMLDDAGTFTVVWGQEFSVRANRRTAAGDWLATAESVAPSPTLGVVAALDAADAPTAIWNRTFFVGGTEFHSIIESRTYDNTGPPSDVTGPVTTMTRPEAAYFLTKVLPVAWTAVDSQSDVQSSRLRVRAAAWNGDYPASFQNLTTFFPGTTFGYNSLPGRTYCFQAQSRDVIPNEGDWSVERCTATPVDDRRATRAGGWTALTGSSYYRRTVLRTSHKGATLTLVGARAKRLALVVSKCPGCGKVEVRFNGALLGTWSLASTTTRHKVVIPVRNYSAVRTGKIVVKVVSMDGKKVLVDGILVRRS